VKYTVNQYLLQRNLLKNQEVETVEKDTMPQEEDQGPARIEEVFINELLIFWAAEHNSKNKKHSKCEYIKYSSSVGK
jgi:hypothetical protein